MAQESWSEPNWEFPVDMRKNRNDPVTIDLLPNKRPTTLSEIDRMPPGCAVTLTLEGIRQGFDWQGRITGKVVGWRNGRVKVLKDGLLRPQWYAPSIWRPIPPDAQIYADWLEERGHTEAAKDFRAHWCP